MKNSKSDNDENTKKNSYDDSDDSDVLNGEDDLPKGANNIIKNARPFEINKYSDVDRYNINVTDDENKKFYSNIQKIDELNNKIDESNKKNYESNNKISENLLSDDNNSEFELSNLSPPEDISDTDQSQSDSIGFS